MTLEEAKALVLREGLVDKDSPDDAVVMILHEGNKPGWEQVRHLVQAIDTVHEAIETETVIERSLAGALWIIGVETSNALSSDWLPEELNDVIALFNAVESALVGFWPIGHPRDKMGAKNDDSTARKTGS